ncbi:SORL-like protein [Mya arenaria]|uniref:Sortilin-related receptor n=1 Tax=Mya arenaria TaxID=6604 RepID=A0ABY7EAK5_MYAAR|nr:SORL-like protein [Mya arenaria]
MAKFLLLLGLFALTHKAELFDISNISKKLYIASHLRENGLTSGTRTVAVDLKHSVQKAEDTLENAVKSALRDRLNQRSRRDVSEGQHLPTKKEYAFNDSHTQMIIHWAGDDSDVVIALTKGPEISGRRSAGENSNVFISNDYGKSFHSIRDKLKTLDGRNATISQFISNPVYKSHYFFLDDVNQYIFTTYDYGSSIWRQRVDFKPTKILFHRSNYNFALALNDGKKLFLTQDFGQNWHYIASDVKSFYWEDSRYGNNDNCIYVHRVTNEEVGSVNRACNYGVHGTPNFNEETIISHAHDFEIQGPYMFVTKRQQLLGGTNYTHQFYVSYYRQAFEMARFDHNLKHLDYYVVDTTEDQILLCVNHGEGSTHLYVSDVNGTRFSLALDDVLYFHPNGSNKDSWLKYYLNEPFADVTKVAGLRGVYIATQLTNQTLTASNQRTLITYDKGGEWQLIEAPEYGTNGDRLACSTASNCSLHLSQKYDRLYAGSRTSPILSVSSAPAIVLGSGNVGQKKYMDDTLGLYVSADAGITWNQALLGKYLFAMLDHGGILVAVRYQTTTNQLLYSTDEGQQWHRYNFSDYKILVHGLLTEPGEKTTQLFLFGSNSTEHSWKVVAVNMSSVFNYMCSSNDYKNWSLPDNTKLHGCLLGRKLQIQRRVPHSNCYNGEDYTHVTTLNNCSCTREDFECDYGYKSMSEIWDPTLVSCIYDNESAAEQNPHQPRPCPAGTFYPYTRGYRKIPGDTCTGGEEHRYSPLQYACRVVDLDEVLLFATPTSVKRLVLPASADDNPSTLFSLARNISAISYQYSQNGCLFWADNAQRAIQKLCEDGKSRIQVLHNTSIGEITSLAYDWSGQNLFWIDRRDRVLEVSRQDGRFRRELIKGLYMDNPHSLVLDPRHGMMYWVDGAQIIQSWMDGTNSSVKSFYQMSGGSITSLALDEVEEKLYWFEEGFLHRVMSSRLDSSSPNLVKSMSSRVSALAVFKSNLIYATSSSISSCDKHSCMRSDLVQSFIYNTRSLMVMDSTTQNLNNTACKENGACSELCLLKPSGGGSSTLTPSRTCRCGTNTTLAVFAGGSNEQCCDKGFSHNASGKCAPQACAENEFQCSNLRCVNSLWKCDGDNDCGDFSDEMDCPKVTCEADYFTCGNGLCIPGMWKCDGDNDCPDSSDEGSASNCIYPTCGADKFSCSGGHCINKNWVCDMEEDCSDGSDERNCSRHINCTENEFSCPSGFPHCILRDNICDGVQNCAGGADEANCTKIICPSYKWQCLNSTSCIYPSWICDGDNDCPDRSDERNCNSTTTPAYPTTKPTCDFHCANGHVCIPRHEQCDGFDDCGDYSDEIGCSQNNCSTRDFKCRNNRCIPLWQRCNGRNECDDWSDELNCQTSTTINPFCRFDEFACTESRHQCIQRGLVCDGKPDCHNGEDENNCQGASCDPEHYFRCDRSSGCIMLRDKCNGQWNCPKGEDEVNCNSTELKPRTKVCPDQRLFPCKYDDMCLPYLMVCDGKMQCPHSSDENLPWCFNNVASDGHVSVKIESATEASVFWSQYNRTSEYIVSYAYLMQQNWHSFNKTGGHHNSLKLTGLHPAEHYSFTVYAILGNGRVMKYPTIQETTKDGVPDPPSSVHLEFKEELELDVTYFSPILTNGNIISYEVCLRDDPKTFQVCETEDGGKRRHVFYNSGSVKFQDKKVYVVQVAASTIGGKSGYKSSNITFGLQKITSYVGNINVEKVDTNGLKVTWTKPTSPVPIDNYVVQIQSSTYTESVTITETEHTFTDLCPATWYMVAVAANNKESGSGPEISTSSQTAGLDVPVPTHINVTLDGVTSVRVTWNASDNYTGDYIVYYDYKATELYSHKVQDFAFKKPVPSSKNSNLNPTTKLTDLRPCEVYYFRVGHSCQGSDLSQAVSIETGADLNAPPKDVRFEFNKMSKTDGQLLWSVCSKGLPAGYMVKYQETSSNKTARYMKPILENPEAQFQSTEIKGLLRGARYQIMVRMNSTGAQWSEMYDFLVEPYAAPTDVVFYLTSVTIDTDDGDSPLIRGFSDDEPLSDVLGI